LHSQDPIIRCDLAGTVEYAKKHAAERAARFTGVKTVAIAADARRDHPSNPMAERDPQ
jgi:hypothetical protein